MGYAIQRGATCMVAALEEVVQKRRFGRVIALLEAAAIVAGGVALAAALHRLPMQPVNWTPAVTTVAGGVLLGLGAFIARACVFGAIAKLGCGHWAYLAVPPGFLAGCFVQRLLGTERPTGTLDFASPTLVWATALLLPFGLLACWRLARVVAAARSGMLADHVWSPHVATSIIGLTFVILLFSAGGWSYTEALSEAARGMTSMTALRLLLFFCLLGGALLGGWTARRLRAIRPTLPAVARCFIGGALMGLGSVLIPGSNDGLILLGLPLLQPHALVALASMAVTITLALRWQVERPLVAQGKMA
nr:YeeE/YedE thiosulfate transporter family protein [Sphingomonas arenae]